MSSKNSCSDLSCTCESSTNDEIKRLCLKCDDQPCDNYRSPTKRYDPGVTHFTSVITPLNDLQPQYSGCKGSVEFIMRRKNKTVTLQWEPFKGKLTTNGVSHLVVTQSISNLPNHLVSFPIFIKYKDVGRMTHLEIDPHNKTGNIKFHLNTDGTSTGVAAHDSVYIHGGAVSWIVE